MSYLPKNEPFFALAPLYDVSDTVFRQIIAGCERPDFFYTEFVNVDGLQSPGREKLLPRLRLAENEKPVIAQLWGKNPDNFRKTTMELIDMGYGGVDINMGCPDKTIVKNGCCSALINDRPLAIEIIKATQEGAAGKIPVSVKARSGFNLEDLTWPELLLKQNLDTLIIHGRTKKQMSAVAANWEFIGKVRELRDQLAPQTKIIGNGDVASRQQGIELAKKYKLDGIMIGRGIFADPFIFTKGKSPWVSWTPKQKLDLYKKHVELFAETWQSDERPVVTLNKFCKMYVNGFEGASEMRAKLMSAKSTDELLKILA